MVHRVLHALLENQLKPSDRGEVQGEEGEEDEDDDADPKRTRYFQSRKKAKEQVKICNTKKLNSRRCQEQLDRAVFCIFLRSMKSWFYTVGTVLSLNHSAKDGDGISVYCSQLGRESKVALRAHEDGENGESNESKLELFMNGVDDELLLPKNWEWQGRGALQIIWQSKDGSEEKIQKLQMLSCVPIVIIPTNTVPIDYAMFLVSPFHKKYEGVQDDIAEKEVDGFAWAEEDEEEGVETCYDASGYPEAAWSCLKCRVIMSRHWLLGEKITLILKFSHQNLQGCLEHSSISKLLAVRMFPLENGPARLMVTDANGVYRRVVHSAVEPSSFWGVNWERKKKELQSLPKVMLRSLDSSRF